MDEQQYSNEARRKNAAMSKYTNDTIASPSRGSIGHATAGYAQAVPADVGAFSILVTELIGVKDRISSSISRRKDVLDRVFGPFPEKESMGRNALSPGLSSRRPVYLLRILRACSKTITMSTLDLKRLPR